MPKRVSRQTGQPEVKRRLNELYELAEKTQAEIAMLKETLRILESLGESGTALPPPLTPVDFSELTVPQAAAQVLVDAKADLHFVEVARRAFAAGFTGQRLDPDTPIEKAAASFRRMMGQRGDVFEPVGEGRYQIAKGVTDPVGMVTPKKKRVFKKSAARQRLTSETLPLED